MATKLGNSLRKSLVAEKKNVDGKIAQPDLFAKANVSAKAAKVKSVGVKTKLSPDLPKPVVKRTKLPAKSATILSAKPKATTNNPKLVMVKKVNPSENYDYTATQVQFKFNNLNDGAKSAVEAGQKLSNACLDNLKLANEDLKEYLNSIQSLKSLTDLIKLNIGYITRLNKRRSEAVANTSKICASMFLPSVLYK